MSTSVAREQPPVPPGWRMRPDPSARTARGGTVLLGGSPLRVLRLRAAGAAAVERWWAGGRVGDEAAERRLARRLLDAGLAHPDPPVVEDRRDVTVVVPVRDRPGELRRCLAAFARRCRVVVVDDGSEDGDAIGNVARSAGATLVRLEPGRGPAAARNAGLREVRTTHVAFVDSDCVVPPGFPGRLRDHLDDPALAVAVPRIVGLASSRRGLLADYEAHHSALDMGTREGLVRAGSAIPYAPGACFVACVAALGAGFAEELRMGEDVDLLWRMGDAGWQVRYDPSVTVAHEHRVELWPWFRRRIAYNESNAPLLRRHPGKVPALSISRPATAFWAVLALGSPSAGAAISVTTAAILGRRLRRYLPAAWWVALRLVVRGHLEEGRHLGRVLTGPWLPFLIAATACRPRAVRRVWLGVAAGAVWEWFERPREPTPVHYLVPKAAEDVARCIGVWLGCLTERRIGALLPQLRHRGG